MKLLSKEQQESHENAKNLKDFVELNVNLDTMIKNLKDVEVNISIATVF